VALITYANGTKEVIMPEAPAKQIYTPKQNKRAAEPTYTGPKVTNMLGFVSLISQIAVNLLTRRMVALVTTPGGLLLLLAITLAPIIMAYISLFQFKNNPEKYKGKWMPVLVLVLNMASILYFALLLLTGGLISSGAGGPVASFLLVVFLVMFGVFIAALIPKRRPLNEQ
jgi:hypothetical protein